MGKVRRNRHSAESKARVAFEAIKGEQTLAEIGPRHRVHLTLVAAWKKAATAGLVETFSAYATKLTRGFAHRMVKQYHGLFVSRDLCPCLSGMIIKDCVRRKTP